jgi:hypothetical protein
MPFRSVSVHCVSVVLSMYGNAVPVSHMLTVRGGFTLAGSC